MKDSRYGKGILSGVHAWLMVLLLVLAGCATFRPGEGERALPGWSVRKILAPTISESSGLVASRNHAGVLWTHNDSGDTARLFAIDASGALLREFRVVGADHVDWEDIAIDDAGHLFIGDFGNNDNQRRDLTIYRVPEPDPRRVDSEDQAEVDVDRVIRFRYAEQTRFPDPEASIYDAESMVWWNDFLYVFTKHRTDTATHVYRIPTAPTAEEHVVTALGRLDLGGELGRLTGNTTAADIRPDGKLVALLTYGAILLYEPDDAMLPSGPVSRIELGWQRTGQVESIAFVGNAIVFGNESRALYTIDTPLAPRWRAFPP